MIKSLHSFALAAMLAPTPPVQNFIVDPDPTRHTGIAGFFKEIKSFFKGEKTSSLEKVVDYFTSTTNPSVVNANGNGGGGVFLYVNDGSLTGTWTRHQIGYVTNTRQPLSTPEINTLGSLLHVITDSSGL